MLPFEGTVDWTKFCELFSMTDFKGVFLLEVEMRESFFKDPQEFLNEAYVRGRQLLKLSHKG
jgi:sugar phosphate isomerase/epimerase